jgi:hypothetical protein
MVDRVDSEGSGERYDESDDAEYDSDNEGVGQQYESDAEGPDDACDDEGPETTQHRNIRQEGVYYKETV